MQENGLRQQEVLSEAPAGPERQEQVGEASEQGQDSLNTQIIEIGQRISSREGFIEERTNALNGIREELGFPPMKDGIPVVDNAREDIERLRAKRAELETRLQGVISSDVSHKYEGVIREARQSKIDWANSTELARRLKLKGASDEDIGQIRDWLVNNASGAKTIILPPDKFREAVDVLHEMTQDHSLGDGSAFYVSGSREDVPENVKDSIFLQEKPPKPPIPPSPGAPASEGVVPSGSVDSTVLHHELGHATEDGVLDSGLYENWQNKIKEGSPDPEYIGKIEETDVRIRSMFRDLAEVFDPTQEPFGEKQIAVLKRMQSRGELSKDTLDLLEHYDDPTLIEHANNLLAI